MATIDATGDLSGAGIDAYGDIAVPGQGGPQGSAGEIIGADAMTLPTGQAATVSLGGTPSKRVLHFGLPRGEQGEQGIEGPEGDVTPEALAAKTAAESARDAAGTARQQAQAAQTAAEQARASSEEYLSDIIEAIDRIDYSDTGWVTVTPGPGTTYKNPLQYRILNGAVYWRGETNTREFAAATWIQLGINLPDECLPGIDTPITLSMDNNVTSKGAVYVESKSIEVAVLTTGSTFVRISGCYPAAPKAHSLSVLQLNLWYGGQQITDGIQRVADVIERSRADVALLSETDNEAYAAVRDALIGRGGEWYAGGVGDVGVVSRLPIRSVTELANRVAKVNVSLRGLSLIAYSVHLNHQYYASYLPRGYAPAAQSGPASEYGDSGPIPGGPVTDTSIIGQVNINSGRPAVMQAVIADATAELAAGNAVLIGGDFNEPSHLDWTAATKDLYDHHSVIYQWDTTKALADAGWLDGYRKLHPDPVTHPGVTWPSDNPLADPGVLGEGANADTRDRVDFVFHPSTGPLALTSATLVGPRGTITHGQRDYTATQDEYDPLSGDWPSDHKGNLQRFRITR